MAEIRAGLMLSEEGEQGFFLACLQGSLTQNLGSGLLRKCESTYFEIYFTKVKKRLLGQMAEMFRPGFIISLCVFSFKNPNSEYCNYVKLVALLNRKQYILFY